MHALRKWLLAGLLVIVPVAITISVLRWIIDTLDQTLLILPQSWHPDRLFGFHIPGFGVLLTLAGELKVPVRFIGIGEQAADMDVFDATEFAAALTGTAPPGTRPAA